MATASPTYGLSTQAHGVGVGKTYVGGSYYYDQWDAGPDDCYRHTWQGDVFEPVIVAKVDIKLNGNVITDTTQDVIVGQKINLVAEIQPAGLTITNQQWTVPGTRVANYEVNYTSETASTSAVVTPLTTTTGDSITFYWVDGGDSREVRFNCTLNNKPFTARAVFNVKRPTVQVMSTTGTVSVGAPFGRLELVFGTPTTPGIKFNRTNFMIPSGFAGETYWVQLASVSRSRRRNNGTFDRFTGSGLDSRFPYSSSMTTTNDSPGLALTGDYTTANLDDSYQMWLMFKASGADSIYVPLRKVNWSWSGVATRSGSQWSLMSSTNIRDPSDADSTTHPTWTSNANVNTTP